MAIHTLEELESSLTEDLKWRKQEMFVFEHLLAQAREHETPSLLRAGLALIYAHWEGFIKTAGSYYLEYISRQKLKLGELRPEIAAVALRSSIEKLAIEKSSEAHGALVTTLWEDGGKDANLPYDKTTIRTRANLKFQVFESIMYSLGLDAARHATQQLLIDERLLGFRNEIAHGRREYVNSQDWVAARNSIELILNDVRTQIANAAALSEYRRSKTPQVIHSDILPNSIEG